MFLVRNRRGDPRQHRPAHVETGPGHLQKLVLLHSVILRRRRLFHIVLLLSIFPCVLRPGARRRRAGTQIDVYVKANALRVCALFVRLIVQFNFFLTHSLTHSLIHSHSLTHSLTHSLSHSLTHTRSLHQSLVYV